MYIKVLFPCFVCLGLGLIPTSSNSKGGLDYEIVYGNKPVGQLSFTIEEDQFYQKLNIFSNISGSPLGLRDGTYNMSSNFLKFSKNGNTWYESNKNTTSYSRSTVIKSQSNKVLEVKITPKSERTSLSSNVNEIDKFYNPAQAFFKILKFPCSKEFQVYDGRRLIQILPTPENTSLKCTYSYQVAGGPGHFPPLQLKKFKIIVHRMDKNTNIGNYLIFKKFLSALYSSILMPSKVISFINTRFKVVKPSAQTQLLSEPPSP